MTVDPINANTNRFYYRQLPLGDTVRVPLSDDYEDSMLEAQRRMRAIPLTPGEHRCKSCGMAFASDEILQSHKSTFHSSEVLGGGELQDSAAMIDAREATEAAGRERQRAEVAEAKLEDLAAQVEALQQQLQLERAERE